MRARRPILLVLTLSVTAAPVWASGPPCEQRGTTALTVPPSFYPPLDRLVSLHVSDISLKEALDRLAAAARVRLIYTVETLPLDRSVCVALDSVSVGQVLATLLAGIPAEAVATGPEQIVLAPVLLVASSMPPIMLDRIVVTGSSAGAAQKPLSLALSTLDGRRLAQGSVNTLAEAMNTAVPGVFMWTQSPSSFVAQYGSVRGSSSFGLSYPKVYIDGIEVANPLLITQISPEAVERIEAIRGPQGAALYGADAISGVTNIVLRQDGADGGRRALMRTGFRVTESRFATNSTLEHTHGLDLRAGPNTRSAGLNVEVATAGEFVPNAYARQVMASATARAVGARTILTGTLRFFKGNAGSPANPLLAAALPTVTATNTTGITGPERMEQHTAGMNLKFQQGNWLTHSLIAGVDGYELNGVPNERLPVPSAADAALVAARGGANRATFRLSSVARLVSGKVLSSDLTLLGEHSPLHVWAAEAATTDKVGASSALTSGQLLKWRSNSGAGGQLNAALFQQLFLTGGLRVERATNVQGQSQLPMFGATWVPAQGVVTLKLRSAYGKGIRWPQTTARATLGEGVHPGSDTISTLAPEEQYGVEGGVDLMVGQAVTIQVTRFDQTAAGLIQRVGVPFDTVLEGVVRRKIAYQLQNVGEIANRGWELQASVHQGPLTLAGTFSVVDSRVTKVARTYTGDLRAGDRMLKVPRTTMSGSAVWSSARWSATVTAYRADNWIYYDRLRIAQLYAAGSRNFTGYGLRQYWRVYRGVTHLRATMTRDLLWRFSVVLTGDNLLNRQTGEPDNIAVLPGRTITVGLRGEF